MRRRGYPTQTDAHAALRHVLECEHAGIHLNDRQTVAGYLGDWCRHLDQPQRKRRGFTVKNLQSPRTHGRRLVK